ncbi:hypothetical protein RRG08_034261 [Elysia crispata]|uniref:Uncharacterized protein n=1 Tax=Elysia crispata TaxID=231223 RepID=A0AAE1A0D5_9GAST|nr:hypothetical protein RRG08_034261 [Elysia crispata]
MHVISLIKLFAHTSSLCGGKRVKSNGMLKRSAYDLHLLNIMKQSVPAASTRVNEIHSTRQLSQMVPEGSEKARDIYKIVYWRSVHVCHRTSWKRVTCSIQRNIC